MKLPLLLSLFLGLFVSSLPAQRKATLLDHKDRIQITKVSALSSPYRETNLSITPDGRYLYFMSLRGGQRWSQSFMTFRGDSVYDGDIWYSRKVAGQWQAPVCMPLGINTPQGEDEPNITPDGQTVYYQSWNSMWEVTGGPYYKAQRKGDEWGLPQGLGGGITDFFRNYRATDGMTISPDEKRFIVAAGQGYDAPMDLFMSTRNIYGWTYCKKLGISTEGDDRSAFLAADGKTLYFASTGYQGLGGMDIYKTTLNSDGTFGEVINIGAPFNTKGDDYGFILTADGMEAYFVRDGNIHFADLREADDRIRPAIPQVHLTLEGTVRDSASWQGLAGEVLIMDARSKVVVKKLRTTSAGRYRLDLPNKTRIYDQIVTVDGYPTARRRITVEARAYSEVIPSNFLLAAPAPQIASNDPQPTRSEIPTPNPPPAPAPDPRPQIGPVTTVQVEPKPQPGPSPQPAPVIAPESPEDPYSFANVAENNLILLLDVSASMRKPEKLPLLKDALDHLLAHMRPEDQISVIVYSGNVDVVLEAVSAAHSEHIMSAIESLRSSGATRGKNALRKAYQVAKEHFISGGNNRIIMATDGYFDVPELYSLADKEAQVQLSVFSFGKLPEDKHQELKTLATHGGGNYASITPDNIDDALLKEAKAVRRSP
ncbi:MAG: VWA domain-containing protein [Bacteroidetes bacterium]|nr:MAG: VWA domain-containing protein [Bacteroidota bacterium]